MCLLCERVAFYPSFGLVLGVGLGPTISKLSVWCLTNLATPTYKTDFFDCVRALPIELSPRVGKNRIRTCNIVLPKQKSFEIAASVFIFYKYYIIIFYKNQIIAMGHLNHSNAPAYSNPIGPIPVSGLAVIRKGSRRPCW